MSQVPVKILQQDYVLSCPDGQEVALREAVAKANQAMQPLCETAKVRTREQAAVLVAVNFAFQNQALQKHIAQLEQQLTQLALSSAAVAEAQTLPQEDLASTERMQALCERIDAVLHPKRISDDHATHSHPPESVPEAGLAPIQAP